METGGNRWVRVGTGVDGWDRVGTGGGAFGLWLHTGVTASGVQGEYHFERNSSFSYPKTYSSEK